jgi:peptidoglycan DL-endopeptidase CwlO
MTWDPARTGRLAHGGVMALEASVLLRSINQGYRTVIAVALAVVMALSALWALNPPSAHGSGNPVASTASQALALLQARVQPAEMSATVTKAPPPLPPAGDPAAPVAAAFRIAGEVAPADAGVPFAAAPTDAPTETAAPAPVEPTYEELRWQLAQLVGPQAGVDPAALDQKWAETDARRMTVVLTGLSKVGSPYRWGASGPDRFDCSGFVGFSWRAVGVSLPRNSSAIIRAISPRDPSTLLPGDVIWRPGHVGLFLGVGEAMVHSPQSGETVKVSPWRRASRWGSPI